MTTLALTVAGAVVIGVSLGLLGGGGSILAVPLLVYVAGLPAGTAITTSLLVVSVTSAVALIPHARAGRVRWRTGLLFGATGMAGAYAGGLVGRHLPAPLLLTAFALMMLATGIGMLRGRRDAAAPAGRELSVPRAVTVGAAVGLLSGLVGAGGGFLVVPALVLVGGLPMAAAVGTSLAVIAMQTLAGFVGHSGGTALDWPLTLAVIAAALAGSLAGGRVAGRMPAAVLRRAFGVLVLAMALLVLAEQVPAGVRGSAWFWPVLLAGALAGATALLVRRRLARPSAVEQPPVASGQTRH